MQHEVSSRQRAVAVRVGTSKAPVGGSGHVSTARQGHGALGSDDPSPPTQPTVARPGMYLDDQVACQGMSIMWQPEFRVTAPQTAMLPSQNGSAPCELSSLPGPLSWRSRFAGGGHATVENRTLAPLAHTAPPPWICQRRGSLARWAPEAARDSTVRGAWRGIEPRAGSSVGLPPPSAYEPRPSPVAGAE
eukprot:354175-Chlamydomonas_euryale.AAC.11